MKLLTIILGTDSTKMREAVKQLAPRGGDKSILWWPEMKVVESTERRHVEPRHDAAVARIADDTIFQAQIKGPHVVVTHSEAFVTRVRRRVAEGAFSDEHVEILWVKEDGTSNRLNINEYGSIENWPYDMFRSTVNDADAVIRAGIIKRTMQAKKGSST